MVQLIKRDFLLMGSAIVAILLIYSIVHLFSIAPLSSYIYMLFMPVFLLFTVDHQTKINRYLVGMPLNRTAFVRSRYLTCLAYMLIISITIWFNDLILDNSDFFPEPHLLLNFPNRIALLSGTITIIALMSLPYYMEMSPITATFLNLGVFLGSMIFLLIITALGFLDLFYLLTGHIAFSTILLAVSLVLLYLSMKQSEHLFSEKDLIYSEILRK